MGPRLQQEIEEGEEVNNPFRTAFLQLISPSLSLHHVLGTTFLLNIGNNPNVSSVRNCLYREFFKCVNLSL